MSNILVETGSIALMTAVPGSGKSLRMLEMMQAHLDAGDLVYQTNITGCCLPGVIKWDDPKEWHELPAGSVYFVDEAQDYFPARRSGEPPQSIRKMERIRHAGIRLVLATQQPNYLDTHLRGLVGRHEHLIRIDGAEQSTIYRSKVVMDNTRTLGPKTVGVDRYPWNFPTKHYAHYKSAEVHTVKKQTSHRMKLVYGLCTVVALCVVGAVTALVMGTGQEKPAAVASASGGTAAQPGRAAAGEQRMSISTADDYATAFTALIPDRPWSAPAFVGRAIVSEPDVMCVASAEGVDGNGDWKAGGCSCLTEQGTEYVLPQDRCREMAREGRPYNPFKAPVRDEDRSRGVGAQAPTAMASTADAGGAAPVGIGTQGPQGSIPKASGTFALDPSPGSPGGAL